MEQPRSASHLVDSRPLLLNYTQKTTPTATRHKTTGTTTTTTTKGDLFHAQIRVNHKVNSGITHANSEHGIPHQNL